VKATYKLRALGNARDIVASSRSLGEAAARLKVDKSTVFRWVRAGKVPPPGGKPGPKAAQVGQLADVPIPTTAISWLERVRATYEFNPTEEVLVQLADIALRLAEDSSLSVPVRMAAAGRFQSLVRQIGFPEEDARASQKDRKFTIA
jgi:hypothetical protein